MIIAIVGAAGKQGTGAASVLARKHEIDELILIDRDDDGLKRVASQVGEKARAVRGDAGDVDGMVEVLESSACGVVLNVAGPGLLFAVPMMKAALRAGCHYVDIQDDAEALPGVRALDGEAREAGVTMVSGAGLAPGLTNILTRRSCDLLDSVADVQLDWVANMTAMPTVANWGHRLGLFAQNVPIVRDHELAYVEGGSGETIVDWPAPAGAVTQRLCAHPELLTLHENLPEIQNLSIRGGYTPREHDELLSDLRALGLTSVDPVLVGEVSISPVVYLSHFATTETFRNTDRFRRILADEAAIGESNGLQVIAKGTKDGGAAQIVYRFFSNDRNIGIYTTAAVITYAVSTNLINDPGVWFPEQLDANLMLSLIQQEEGVAISEVQG